MMGAVNRATLAAFEGSSKCHLIGSYAVGSFLMLWGDSELILVVFEKPRGNSQWQHHAFLTVHSLKAVLRRSINQTSGFAKVCVLRDPLKLRLKK